MVSEARRCFLEAGGEVSGEEGSLSAGSYAVGEGVQPGRWEARYQLEDDEFCSFTRMDENGDVIASEVVSGPDRAPWRSKWPMVTPGWWWRAPAASNWLDSSSTFGNG